MKSIIAIAICSLFITSLSFPRTCVVIIKDSHRILVALDSKETNGLDLTQSRTVCKIFQSGKTFFSFAGSKGGPENPIFDAVSLAYKACQERATIREQFYLFDSLTRSPLTKYLESRKYSEMLDDSIIPGFVGMQAAFFGIEENLPVYYRIRYYDTISTSINVKLLNDTLTCPGTFPAQYIVMDVLGNDSCSTTYRNSIPKQYIPWIRLDSLALRMVEKEIECDSLAVGGTIGILEIRSDGAFWRKRNGICPEFKPFEPTEVLK